MYVYIQCCQRCYLHKQHGHAEYEYYQNYAKLSSLIEKRCSLQLIKNKIPLIKDDVSYSSTSFGKSQQQLKLQMCIIKPQIASFEVKYKNLLIFSYFQTQQFPNLLTVCFIIQTLKKINNCFNIQCEIQNQGNASLYQLVRDKLIPTSTTYSNQKVIQLKEIQNLLIGINQAKQRKFDYIRKDNQSVIKDNKLIIKNYKQETTHTKFSKNKENNYFIIKRGKSSSKQYKKTYRDSQQHQLKSANLLQERLNNRLLTTQSSHQSGITKNRKNLVCQQKLKKVGNKQKSNKKSKASQQNPNQLSKNEQKKYSILSQQKYLLTLNSSKSNAKQSKISTSNNINRSRNSTLSKRFSNLYTQKHQVVCSILKHQFQQDKYGYLTKEIDCVNIEDDHFVYQKLKRTQKTLKSDKIQEIQTSEKTEKPQAFIRKNNQFVTPQNQMFLNVKQAFQLQELSQDTDSQTPVNQVQTKAKYLIKFYQQKLKKQQSMRQINQKQEQNQSRLKYSSTIIKSTNKAQQQNLYQSNKDQENKKKKTIIKNSNNNQNQLQICTNLYKVEQIINIGQPNIQQVDKKDQQNKEILQIKQIEHSIQVQQKQKQHNQLFVKSQQHLVDSQQQQKYQKITTSKQRKISSKRQQKLKLKNINNIQLIANNNQTVKDGSLKQKCAFISINQLPLIYCTQDNNNLVLTSESNQQQKIQNIKSQQKDLYQLLQNQVDLQKSSINYMDDQGDIQQIMEQNNINKQVYAQYFSNQLNGFKQNSNKFLNQEQINSQKKFEQIQKFLVRYHPSPMMLFTLWTKNSPSKQKSLQKKILKFVQSAFNPSESSPTICKMFLIKQNQTIIRVHKVCLNQKNVQKSKLYLSKEDDQLQMLINLEDVFRRKQPVGNQSKSRYRDQNYAQVLFYFYHQSYHLLKKTINQKQFVKSTVHNEKCKQLVSKHKFKFNVSPYDSQNQKAQENHIFISYKQNEKQQPAIKRSNDSVSIQIKSKQTKKLIGSIQRKNEFFFQLNLQPGDYQLKLKIKDRTLQSNHENQMDNFSEIIFYSQAQIKFI